jgi:hypothetical protein
LIRNDPAQYSDNHLVTESWQMLQLQSPCGCLADATKSSGMETSQQQNLTKREKEMVGPQVIAAGQNHFVGIGHGTSS